MMLFFTGPLFRIIGATCEQSFFGLIPWYHYLPASDYPNCSFLHFQILGSGGTSSDIPLVVLAIIDDLLRLAGLVTVGFVVYGGFQYVTSQGQPDKTARAQNTVTDALIGLAVAIAAVTIVSFIATKLGGT